jgi:hypothetical protein
LPGQMPGVELGDRHSPLARLLAYMREGTEWKRGRAQLWVQSASAKGTRGGSKESGSRSGMQEGNEGNADANAHARRKCGEGTSVEAKSGYYTMQVSKIPECAMRGRGVRD